MNNTTVDTRNTTAVRPEEIQPIEWEIGLWTTNDYKGKYMNFKGVSTPAGTTFTEVYFNNKLCSFQKYTKILDKNPGILEKLKNMLYEKHPETKKWADEYAEQKRLLKAIGDMKLNKPENPVATPVVVNPELTIKEL